VKRSAKNKHNGVNSEKVVKKNKGSGWMNLDHLMNQEVHI